MNWSLVSQAQNEYELAAGSLLTGRHIHAQMYTANAVQLVNSFAGCGMSHS